MDQQSRENGKEGKSRRNKTLLNKPPREELSIIQNQRKGVVINQAIQEIFQNLEQFESANATMNEADTYSEHEFNVPVPYFTAKSKK